MWSHFFYKCYWENCEGENGQSRWCWILGFVYRGGLRARGCQILLQSRWECRVSSPLCLDAGHLQLLLPSEMRMEPNKVSCESTLEGRDIALTQPSIKAVCHFSMFTIWAVRAGTEFGNSAFQPHCHTLVLQLRVYLPYWNEAQIVFASHPSSTQPQFAD